MNNETETYWINGKVYQPENDWSKIKENTKAVIKLRSGRRVKLTIMVAETDFAIRDKNDKIYLDHEVENVLIQTK